MSDPYNTTFSSFSGFPVGIPGSKYDKTPTSQRQQFERGRALQAELDAMVAANGGGLSDKQLAYIRRKARELRLGR